MECKLIHSSFDISLMLIAFNLCVTLNTVFITQRKCLKIYAP